MDPLTVSWVLVVVTLAFGVSSAAGLGGSLVLVPALSILLGVKEGVALAALLLASNNVVKLIAYRATIPIRAAGVLAAVTGLGAIVGARLLVAAPEELVAVAVVVAIAGTFVVERMRLRRTALVSAPALSLVSGATSGISGTSGPLKGIAIRALGLDRLHMVGAAALVSFIGDAAKTGIYAEASLLGPDAIRLTVAAFPLMVLATFAGRKVNRAIGERGYAMLFWGVLGGYSFRLLLA